MKQNWSQVLEGPRAKRLFGRLYGKDDQTVNKQIDRYIRLIQAYKEHFPDDKGYIHLFSTPGRTEIGGNHTDHNGGCVLAAAVHFDAIAAVTAVDDDKIILYSEGYPDAFIADLSHLQPVARERGTTSALIRGIAARFRQLGYSAGGFHAYVSSSVAIGSGLSSSASIEVLLATILNALYNNNQLDPVLLAEIGQYAERNYFGKPCGLMDQMACAIGGCIEIDFKGSGRPAYKKVNFDPEEHGFRLLVADTGESHEDLTQDYADIYQEMTAVAQVLGKKLLRELSFEDIIKHVAMLREKAGDRAVLRAMHFFLENRRVAAQAKALEENRFDDFLELVRESGSSSWRLLQNCYSLNNPSEQGIALALALTENFISQIGKGACRVHGGGFAGTIQAYLPGKCAEEYSHMMEGVFGKNSVTALSVRNEGTLHLNSFL